MTTPATGGVTAIIPARGGSKGLPRKNVLPLLGKFETPKPLPASISEAVLTQPKAVSGADPAMPTTAH